MEERNDCGGDNDAKTCNLECNVGDNNINDDDNKVLNKQNNDKEISNDSDELVKERDSETALDEEDYYSDDCSDSNDGQDDKETEIEQKAELLNKTRVLPSWMTKDKGQFLTHFFIQIKLISCFIFNLSIFKLISSL